MQSSKCVLCKEPIANDEICHHVRWVQNKHLFRHLACTKEIEAALVKRGIKPYQHPVNQKALREATKEALAIIQGKS